MFRITLIVSMCFVTIYGMSLDKAPTHCTTLTKDTDYSGKFKFDYPLAYIHPGQREAYQQLFCVNPPNVTRTATTVCDLAAPPQVQFTLGDDYVHVIRQDPTGRYQGNAVIKTVQFCGHKRLRDLENEINVPSLSDYENAII